MCFLNVIIILSLLHLIDACQDYTECVLPDGRVGMCFMKTCLSHIDDELRENLTFTIRVKYPDSVLQNHRCITLYIRGNGLCLQWMKGKRLLKTGNDTWQIDITYKSLLTKYQCQTYWYKSYLPNNKLQYRILVDDHNDMLGANFIINFPLSATSSFFNEKPVFTSYPWFFNKTGDITSFVINSTNIGKNRNLTLYTPPSFYENTYKTYPTIFVLDLKLQFAKFFKRNFEGPIYPHEVSQEYALIGFGEYRNDGKERFDLLTPNVGPFYFCINGTFDDNCNGCIPTNISYKEFIKYLVNVCGRRTILGGQGDNMLTFLEKEALHYANSLASGRLQTNNLGIMGYSLGGLLSCHAIWTRPHVYYSMACQSPSFWWPANNESFLAADFDFINKTLKNPLFQTNRSEQKIYLDVGGLEVTAPWKLAQATVEVSSIITDFQHYTLDRNVWVHVHANNTHTYIEWGRRMGQALATLLSPGGEQHMLSNKVRPIQDGAERIQNMLIVI